MAHEISLGTPEIHVGERRHGPRDERMWVGVVEICWDDAVLPVYVDVMPDAAKLAPDRKLAARLLNSSAAELARLCRLRSFRENDVHFFDAELPEGDGPITLTVRDDYFQKLMDDHRQDVLARQKFRRAVDQLDRATDAASDMEAYHVIQRLLSAGHIGVGVGWYDEKLSRIYRTISAERKNPRRGKSREEVSDLLRHFEPPLAWVSGSALG